MRNASAAQRELVAQGRLSSGTSSEDSQWSEGLVSAVSSNLSLLCACVCVCAAKSWAFSLNLPNLSSVGLIELVYESP